MSGYLRMLSLEEYLRRAYAQSVAQHRLVIERCDDALIVTVAAAEADRQMPWPPRGTAVLVLSVEDNAVCPAE